MVSEPAGRPEPPGPYGIGSDTWPGLATLAKDAAEVLQLARTIMAGGDDAGHDPASLRESLQQELGDLRAAIDYVIGKNALDWSAVNRRRDRKRSHYDRTTPRPRRPPATAHRPPATAQPARADTGSPSAQDPPTPDGQPPSGSEAISPAPAGSSHAHETPGGGEAGGAGYNGSVPRVPGDHAAPGTAIPGPRGPAGGADPDLRDQEAAGQGQPGLRQRARPPRAAQGRPARSRTRTRASAAT